MSLSSVTHSRVYVKMFYSSLTGSFLSWNLWISVGHQTAAWQLSRRHTASIKTPRWQCQQPAPETEQMYSILSVNCQSLCWTRPGTDPAIQQARYRGWLFASNSVSLGRENISFHRSVILFAEIIEQTRPVFASGLTSYIFYPSLVFHWRQKPNDDKCCSATGLRSYWVYKFADYESPCCMQVNNVYFLPV